MKIKWILQAVLLAWLAGPLRAAEGPEFCGKEVPRTPAQLLELRKCQTESAQRRAALAQRQAEDEKLRADAAEQQARALKAEIERLRAAQPKPAPAPIAPAPVGDFGIELKSIPGGRFQMGANDGYSDEKPVREVTVRPFLLGKTEVTQGQWKAVMGSNPSYFKDCGDDCPVENVSWEQVRDFVKKLNGKTTGGYRLPTEAEWEYAARGGTKTAYWWGDTASHEYANYGRDTCCGGLAQGRDQWEHTAPVGRFPANPFGLFDMHGNVWEWVADCWHDSYNGNPPTDGSEWKGGCNGDSRVLRGGSWDYYPRVVRSADRNGVSPVNRISFVGFRLARTLP